MNGGSRQPGCMSIDVPNITSISDLAKIPVEGKFFEILALFLI